MQTKNVDGQVSLFGPDWPHGRMCLESIQAASRPARTFSRSSRRSSALKNRTLMLLDLRPGAGNLLGPYWEYDPAWLGPPGRLNTSECPKGAVDASLSQILLDTVPSRYYLSRKACLGILRRAKERGKPLPPQLEQALKLQAGTADNGALDQSGVPRAFHINQREETIDLGDTAGALMATTNMQVQTFVAAFSAGTGACAGSIGYQEETAPTLKGTQSGSMMPAVLCLNDQGGGVMDCSEDVIGTLRAQEHGHQPAVLFENHGIDGRYTGPIRFRPHCPQELGPAAITCLLPFSKITVPLLPSSFAGSFRRNASCYKGSLRGGRTSLALPTPPDTKLWATASPCPVWSISCRASPWSSGPDGDLLVSLRFPTYLRWLWL